MNSTAVAAGLCPRCLISNLEALLDLEPPLEADEPDQIGPYLLLERMGEGGMGTVWRARQMEPVEREVAIKVIKLGMDTREVIKRFQAERQALAMMDHPDISRVFEAGSTKEGRPYFVMELVAGEPVTDFCIKRGLPMRERLDLFSRICLAVEHAHQKGIIHRDLKPSNILASEGPEGIALKIIDFGIAKAVEVDAFDQTYKTVVGQVVGTPGYMSPEQAGAEVDIDTRSDVYSLGAVLYEMLAGSPPMGRETFREVARVEVMRLIRETDPPRPSTRLDPLTSGGSDLRIARDLDRIVMKALARERERRYGGASALAEDVRRFLNHEPVTASDPTLAYRIGRFVRKHRMPVIFCILFLLGLIAAGMLVLRENRRARAAAEQERVARAETLGALADAYRNNGLAASRNHDDGLAALWFTKAAQMVPHDPERSLANRLRANLHSERALSPVRKFERIRQSGSRMFFDDSSRFLHEGWFGERHRFYDLEAGRELDFGYAVQAGCLLPGGGLAAVSDASAKVEIRGLETLEVLKGITLPEGKATGVWTDDSGSLLALGDEQLWIWDRRGGAFIGGPLLHPAAVRYSRFSPDGSRLLTVDDKNEVRVFSTSGAEEAMFGPLHVEGAGSYDFLLPDFIDGSEQIRVKGRPGMRVFNVESGELVARLPQLDRAVDFTRRGDLFGAHNVVGESETGVIRISKPFGGALFLEDDAAFYGTGTGDLFDLTGTRKGRIAVAGDPFAFSPDGTLMATGHGAHLTVHQLTIREPFWRITVAGAGRIALSSDERLFASAGWSGTHPTGTKTQAFHSEDGTPAGPVIDTGVQHLCGTFSGGTTQLLTGGRKDAVAFPLDHESVGGAGVVQLWEATNGRRLSEPLELPSEPWAMLPHPTEPWVAVICRDGRLLRVAVDLSGFEEILQLDFRLGSEVENRTQGRLVFSQDGSRLYASGFGSLVWAIDPEEKRIVFQTAERLGPVLGLEVAGGVLFSPTSRAEDEWLFDADTGEVRPLSREVKPHLPLGSQISRDGSELLFSGVTRVSVVDRATGEAIGPGFQAGTDWVSYSAFVKDSPWILTASTSKEDISQLVLWDRRSGKPLGPHWSLRGTGLGDLVSTADGRRAILSIRGEGYLLVDLDEIRAAEEWSHGLTDADRLTLAELRAGRRLVDQSPTVLDTPDAWIPVWNELFGRHPEVFPLKPDREALIRWHRNRRAFFQTGNGFAAEWHRQRIEQLGKKK